MAAFFIRNAHVGPLGLSRTETCKHAISHGLEASAGSQCTTNIYRYWRNPQKNKIRDCKIPTKSRKANSNTNLQTRAAKPRVAGDWFWNLPWVMRWEFYNPWFIFSGDSHYSLVSWNFSEKVRDWFVFLTSERDKPVFLTSERDKPIPNFCCLNTATVWRNFFPSIYRR